MVKLITANSARDLSLAKDEEKVVEEKLSEYNSLIKSAAERGYRHVRLWLPPRKTAADRVVEELTKAGYESSRGFGGEIVVKW